jgi:hypothetical protein
VDSKIHRIVPSELNAIPSLRLAMFEESIAATIERSCLRKDLEVRALKEYQFSEFHGSI